MFDEIALQKGIYYNSTYGRVLGFENFGHLGTTSSIATHALVFIVRGVGRHWKLPIGYFYSRNTTPSNVLAQLLVDAIKMLQSIGLNVVASVSDQGSTNRGAVNILRYECEEGEYESVYSVDGKIIVHLWDTPHLLKNVRNNFLAANVRFGRRGQFVAKWNDILQYNEVDILQYGHKSGLTHDHLYPSGKVKMRVKPAAQVLSYSLASAICSIVVASEGRTLADCLHTAKFLCDMDLLYDVCNGPGRKDKPKPQRCHVTEGSIHHHLWTKYRKSLRTVKFVRQVTDKKGNVSIKTSVPPCITGWIDNLKGFQRLWKTLSHESVGLTEMNLRCFNSDPVENFFSAIRQSNGSNRYPTVSQFQSAYKSVTMNDMSRHCKSYSKNCMDDDAEFLSSLDDPSNEIETENCVSNSNLFVPEKKCVLVRGKDDFAKCINKTFLKHTRQGPSLQCYSVTQTVLKTPEISSCRLCKNSLLVHEDENSSSDQIFSSNLSNGLTDCLLSDSFDYAELVKTTRHNQAKAAGIGASPTFVTVYIKCLTGFLTVCSDNMFKENALEWAVSLFQTWDKFDWLCPIHMETVKPILLKSMAECFLKFTCKMVNKHLKDSLKKKHLLSKLRAKKAVTKAPVTSNGQDDCDWIDISDEEASALERYLSVNDPDDPGSSTGNYSALSIIVILISFCLQEYLFITLVAWQFYRGKLTPGPQQFLGSI